jgi:hypothetical protein
MRVLKLPDLPVFRNFKTVGPNGDHPADINGLGAAIECYLDLDHNACVRWNNFMASANAYQGELIGKDRYKRTFLDQTGKVPSYNYDKITSVLEMIRKHCVSMREAVLDKELEGRPEDL